MFSKRYGYWLVTTKNQLQSGNYDFSDDTGPYGQRLLAMISKRP